MATDCDGDSLYCYILSWGRHIDAFARTVAARISHDNEVRVILFCFDAFVLVVTACGVRL